MLKNNIQKKCSKCKHKKEEFYFYKKKASKDGLATQCKSCSDLDVTRIIRTKTGLVSQIYTSQKHSSKKRNHAPPTYTKEEFEEWLFSQPNFKTIYDNWVASGYEKDLKPSVDRPDDYKGYSFDNIQLMTWKENREIFKNKIKNGEISISSKQVVQIISDEEEVIFYSIKNAERNTGIYNNNISSVCQGKRKTAGGFKWKYL